MSPPPSKSPRKSSRRHLRSFNAKVAEGREAIQMEILSFFFSASLRGLCASAFQTTAWNHGWQPDSLFAGNVIVRLKKARGYLKDAIRGLDAADEEALAIPQWRYETRIKIIDVLTQTDVLLREARGVYAPPR